MLDTSEEYGMRAAADEAVIRSAEQSASNARKRVSQLELQMEKFSALIGQLDGAPAETAAADVDIA